MKLRPETNLSRAVDCSQLDVVAVVGVVQLHGVAPMDCVVPGQADLRDDPPLPALGGPRHPGPASSEHQDVLHDGVERDRGPGQEELPVTGQDCFHLGCDHWCPRYPCQIVDCLCCCHTVGGNTLVLAQVLVTRRHVPHVQAHLVGRQLGDGQVGHVGQLDVGHPVPHYVGGRGRGHRAHEAHLQSGPGQCPHLLDPDNRWISCNVNIIRSGLSNWPVIL